MNTLIRWFKRALILFCFFAVVYLCTPVQLNVPLKYQYPELPNGCEVVSVAMVANYYGVPTDGTTLADGYLTKAPLGAQLPNEAYMGDPRGDGYYCYPQPLVAASNQYFQAMNAPLHAHAPFLMDWFRMSWQIHRGRPVIVWTTIDDKRPRRQPGVAWKMSDGQTYEPYENLHVVVVDGVSGWNLHIQDPINGSKWVFAPIFMAHYLEMGLRSVVISP